MSATIKTLFEDAPPHPSADEPASSLLVAPPGWPAAPAGVAYHGIVGEIVKRLTPETEADPVAILTQLLVAFGTAVGRGAYFEIEATRHHPHEFLCAARRLVVSPVQPGVIRKVITGSNGLPRAER
jgi:hypothetical protein